MLIMLNGKSFVHSFLERWSVADWGDYQCNNAMMIFKEHGAGKTKIDRNVRWVRTEMTAPMQREREREIVRECTRYYDSVNSSQLCQLLVQAWALIALCRLVKPLGSKCWSELKRYEKHSSSNISHIFTLCAVRICTLHALHKLRISFGLDSG